MNGNGINANSKFTLYPSIPVGISVVKLHGKEYNLRQASKNDIFVYAVDNIA
jgi:hypothetical protein